VTPTRFADYLRLSTDDKQDPALAFPSQHKANERKAAVHNGEIVCSFTDQETGAKADRPGWAALMAEARDRANRRFDGVVIYNTSRLARDRMLAALYERELRAVGVTVIYAMGAGDTQTPEGQMFVGMQQLWDEFERNKLARETKRGMREATEQGWRMGGRANYGYQRKLHPLPEGHRGVEKQRVTLVPHPDEAPVRVEISHLHADLGWGLKAIVNHLNRPGGPPPPAHVDPSRNRGGHWSTSSIRSMLMNPVYTGRTVWNRLDFANARQNGGGPRLRAEEEWVVAPQTHVALVSDEQFKRSQERFRSRSRRQHTSGATTAGAARSYTLAGLVHCCSGHQPLSMQGKTRKGHVYYACGYGTSYGDTAATEIHAGQKYVSLREDDLRPLVEKFLTERVWGPMRLQKLAQQIRGYDRERKRGEKLEATKLREVIATAERNISAQVRLVETGVQPDVVKTRIDELQAEQRAAREALDAIGADQIEAEDDCLAERLAQIPDLTEQLRDATPAVRRQILQAFELRIEWDKARGSVNISATVTEAVAGAFEDTKALHSEGLVTNGSVPVSDIAGAGFEPATFGL
jgi:site-specific DNA recombinase